MLNEFERHDLKKYLLEHHTYIRPI